MLKMPTKCRRMRSCATALWIAPILLVLSHGADRAGAADIPREAARSIQEGNRLLDGGHHEKALEMFERAAAKAPRLAEAAFNRGVALYRLGRFEEAETAFQDALRPGRPDLEPRATYNLARTAHASALARGADLEAGLKDITRAINFYKDALALKPNDQDAVRNLAMAEGMQAFLKRKLEQIQKEQPPDSDGSPSDSEDNDSDHEPKQSDQGEQGDSKSDESNEGDESREDSSSESRDSSDRQGKAEDSIGDSQGQEGGEPSEQPEQSDSEPSEDQRDGSNADREASEREGLASPEGDGTTDDDTSKSDTESAADAATQPAESGRTEQESDEAEAQSQPEDSAAQEEGEDLESSTTTQPASGFDINDLSREHALRLLEDAREMERKRRDTLRRRALMRRGRIEVEKDW